MNEETEKDILIELVELRKEIKHLKQIIMEKKRVYDELRNNSYWEIPRVSCDVG